MNDYLQLVTRCLSRHIARHGHRLLQTDGRLNDLYVSIREAQILLGRGLPGAASEAGVSARAGLPTLEEAERAVAEWEQEHRPGDDSPLEKLRSLFDLSEAQIRLLAAAAAPHLATDIGRLYGFAWADFAVKQPWVGFLAELLAGDEEERNSYLGELRSDQPLIRHRLVSLGESPVWREGTTLLHRTVSVPDAVVAYLSGRELRLPDWMSLSGPGALGGEAIPRVDSLVIREDTRKTIEALLEAALAEPSTGPRLLLLGPPGSGRRTVLSAELAERDRNLLTVDASPLAADGGEGLETALAEACREALIRGCLLLVRGDGLFDDTERLAEVGEAFGRILDEHPGPLALTARRASARLHGRLQRLVEVVIPSPTSAQQRTLWRRALADAGSPSEELADQLVLRFDLPPGTIHGTTEDARTRAALLAGDTSPGPLTLEQVAEAVRRRADHALSEVADPFLTTLTWDDVVLPEDTVARLEEILSHARHRERVLDGWGFRRKLSYGQGLSCLFAGPPGTGKTMVAGVLARRLGREIYRVDISRVTSRWVGETEKNLARVFDEAERAQVILLFDEADSLFSTRTDVRSSNDRFANMEVNYLLQRMESYDGMTVLTTNFEQSLDEAFKRRIRFWVGFPFPEPPLRARLWESMLPPEATVEDAVDFDELGLEFHLSGGSIKNAVLRAAFYAVEDDGPITFEHLWRAGTAETRDMGFLIREE